MLVSLWGNRWREVVPVMFSLYIDDSGTSPSQPVAIATALIIPAAQLVRLQNEWERFQSKEGFKCFHASEFYFRNHKSEFAKWGDEKWERTFKRVTQISKKYGVRAISIAVLKKDYDDVVPSDTDIRSYLGKTHYGWAVRQLLANVELLYPFQQAPREFVFQWIERKEKSRKEIEDIMDQMQFVYEKQGLCADYSDPHFRNSVGIPGLQCVDFVSWISYQFAIFIYKKIPLRPLVEGAWRTFEGHRGSHGWLRAFTQKRNNLQKSVTEAITTGKAAKFFQEWSIARGR
jgi:hypothetical protein